MRSKILIKPVIKLYLEKISPSIYMSIVKRDVLGLNYHVVSGEKLPYINHLYSYKSPEIFELDLIYLAHNFNLITYDQLVAHYSGFQELKKKSVILTFDDGLAECYSIIRPLLLKHGIPGTFFIPTNFIDNKKMFLGHKISLCIDRIISIEENEFLDILSIINNTLNKEFSDKANLIFWIKSLIGDNQYSTDMLCKILEIDIQNYLKIKRPYLSSVEIKNMVMDGFTIGSHSLGHQRLALMTELKIEEEIIESCKVIKVFSGKEKIPFAFPFNADGVSRNMLQNFRQKYNFLGLLFNSHGIRNDRDFIYSRICGDSPEKPNQNKTNISSFIARAYIEDMINKCTKFESVKL